MKPRTKCPVCNKNQANIDSTYGVLPCDICQLELDIPSNNPLEFTSESIKNQRKEYQTSMLQPFVNGVLSKEFIEAHGTSKLSVTKKDIKEAKYVYKHLPRWHKRNESKL